MYRFSGSLSALIYIFALPCLVYIMSLMRDPLTQEQILMSKQSSEPHKIKPVLRMSNLTKKGWVMVVIHIGIIILGLANFIAQIVITVRS